LRYAYHIDKGDELGVLVLVEWLSEAVSGHVDAREVIELDGAILVLLFGVFKTSVNVLCTLVVTILLDHIKRWLIVGVQLRRFEIRTDVVDLEEQAYKPAHLFGRIRHGDVLGFGG
jgi:hypothetical protein